MHSRNRFSRDQGFIAIMIAVSLTVFLGFAAFVIDLGFGLVTRNQLQNITDGAALAGTRHLGRIYEGLTASALQGYVLTGSDKSAIVAKVREVGESNAAGGKFISINTADIVIGRWDLINKQLTPTDERPDAVRVRARRDDQANSPLTTFFAGTVGTASLNVSAQATAALTGIDKVPARELDAPIGVARGWFDNQTNFCDQTIQFSPKNETASCAGWHTFFETPNASNLRDIISGLRAGTFDSPGGRAGEVQFNFIGGDVSFAYHEFQMLYEDRAVCSTTGVSCSAAPCDGTCEWSAFIGIYDLADCSNPNGPLTIVGFATARIFDVLGPPERNVTARIGCDAVQPNTRGGGGDFGTKGSIPGLVQ